MVGPRVRADELERRVFEAVSCDKALPANSIVVHFDLVAEVLSTDGSGDEQLKRHHWAPHGADPHMSFAVLQAAADTVRAELQ